MTDCLTCPGDPHDPMVGYLVCARCKQTIAHRLEDFLPLYVETEQQLATAAGGHSSKEHTAGLRIIALNILAGHDLLAVLGSWEQDWRETFGHPPPPTRWVYDRHYRRRVMPVPATLAAILDYLQRALDLACRRHPAIDEFAHEVRELHAELKVAARMMDPLDWRVDCPADGCGRNLRVDPDLDAEVDCHGCGTRWTTRRLLLVALADRESELWLPLDEASRMAGIPERTIERWGQQGLVDRHGGLYALGSLRAATMGALG